MPIFNHKDANKPIKSQGKHPGAFNNRTDSAYDECETSSDDVRISGLWQRTAREVMKAILRIFGYRERTQEIFDAIQESCEIRVEAEKRLERLRTTLDGEDSWFSKKEQEKQKDERVS